MLYKIDYIMKDQNRGTVNAIMSYDLTWRQKRSNRSLHLSVLAGLTVISLVTQIL